MRAPATVAVLTVLLGALTVSQAPPASAQCSGPTPQGADLPATAGQEPLIDRLGLRRVWEVSRGAGVRVAVVDSGVFAAHPKLLGALAPSVDLIPAYTGSAPFGVVSPGNGTDCENHGTPIAGIIAARPAGDDRVVGVAPDATIVPIRFDGDVAQAPDVMIAAAIRTAADQARVMNLSFAVPIDNTPIREAIQYAQSRDVVIVAAAGNENENQPGYSWFPAAYPGVLAVAALDAQGRPTNASNRGPWIGIAAPGENITALSSGGGYTVVSGTSFATAIVSGTAALVRAKYPAMPATQVIERLRGTAVSLSGGIDERVGAGIIDPFLALTAADLAAPPTALPQARGEAIRVLPLPTDPDVLGVVGRWALAVTAIVLALAAVVGLAGMTLRRIAVRRGRFADPHRRYGDVQRPVEPIPEDSLS
jgi:type VII secretion-associated serine protease mycosin